MTAAHQPPQLITHHISRFKLEYFCCLTALNLYRAGLQMEDYANTRLHDRLDELLVANEDEWMELSGVETPDIEAQTGYARSQWRKGVIRGYLRALLEKSSRDPDAYVAIRRFFARQGLASEVNVPLSPALLESCAESLSPRGNWLLRYLEHLQVKEA